MRIVAVSDLHLDETCRSALLRQAEAADLVIGAGDYAQNHEGLAGYLAPLEAIADKTLLVPGNNETLDALTAATSATVLHGTAVTRGGLTVAGLGGAVPPLPPNAWGSWDLTEADALAAMEGIDRADILVCHAPPKGVADWHSEVGSYGSTAIRALIERLRPRLFLCGHLHDSWGSRGRIGETLVANLGPVPVWFEL